jgi:hypothetical protein
VGSQSANWKADLKGQKLLDFDREIELGHRIAVINEKRFLALVGALQDREHARSRGR